MHLSHAVLEKEIKLRQKTGLYGAGKRRFKAGKQTWHGNGG